MSAARLTVLILGGYGTFGGRLAQLLADESRLTLIVAGRSIERAKTFCDELPSVAVMQPLTFDREGDVEHQLRQAAPDIVVDASGPFQNYVGDPYRLVRACLSLGIHYLDLADGADFVKGIGRFDGEAKTRGVFILSGVSSCPVLTAAVVRSLAAGMARVDTVTGGIAPSPYAGVGLNVIRAIASYAGQPIELHDGTHHALVETRRFTIAPPGHLPLKSIRFSLVDVPDLKLLPDLWPSLKSVWIGAGPVPEILHRALNATARLVSWRLIPSLSPFAPLMHWVIKALRWGEHRGGMFVCVRGADAFGTSVDRSWHMVAEGDDGPFIPSMAVEALVRQLLDGRSPSPGARAATTALELSDYDALFARRRIYTGVRDALPAIAPLYRRLLGEAYNRLPDPIQQMHDLDGSMTAEGVAQVDRGSGVLARAVAAIMGFPNAGANIPLRVDFSRDGDREVWRRNFAGTSFSSTQEEGRGRSERLLRERFGPFAFDLALVVDDGRLRLVVRRWSLFAVPLPLAFAPGGEAYEHAADGRFNFHVEIGHPLTGLIVRYRGWLVRRLNALPAGA